MKKDTAAKNTSTKTKKPAVNKTTPDKKNASKTAADRTSAAKKLSKPALKSKPVEKPEIPAEQQNHGLPNGSEIQQTGQRRPLIVYPK